MKIRFIPEFLSASFVVVPLLLGAAACGPMNPKSTSDTSPISASNRVPKSEVPTQSGVAFTKKQVFIIDTKFVDDQGDVVQPQKGDNTFLIRFIHGKDLQVPANDAEVKVQYVHPNRLHPPAPWDVKDIVSPEDGTYTMTVNFVTTGNWEIHIHLKDGDLQDDYVAKVKI
jgi:hypothetical protein